MNATLSSELITHCFPAFGGAFLRRIYTILDHAIGQGCPLTVAIAGPVTVSGQHQAWLIPLLETGWVAYLRRPTRCVITTGIARSTRIAMADLRSSDLGR